MRTKRTTGARKKHNKYRNRQRSDNNKSRYRPSFTNYGLPRVVRSMLNWNGKTVYLCCGHTDMRKQINGLMVAVKDSFNLNPFDKALFVFCNRRRDRIKILEWDEDGFWLYFKRLERGHFKWPQPGDTCTMTLTAEEFAVLLGGVRVELKLKRNEVKERNIS